MPRLPQKIIRSIREVRHTATMKTASFGDTHYVPCDANGTPHPGAPAVTLDKLIKDRTAAYRNSWLIAPLDSVLEWSDRA